MANAKIEALQKQVPQDGDPAAQRALRARLLVRINNLDLHQANIHASRRASQERSAKRVRDLIQNCDLAIAQATELKAQLQDREPQVTAAHESCHAKRDQAYAAVRAIHPPAADEQMAPEPAKTNADSAPDKFAEMDRNPPAITPSTTSPR